MTGYGKTFIELTTRKITIEIKSLNSKQIDISLRIPSFVREKEMEIRNLIISNLERGKIDVLISSEYIEGKADNILNFDVIKAHYKSLKQLSEEIGENTTDYLSLILKFPDIFLGNTGELEEFEWELLKRAILNCLDNLNNFRTLEGKALETDFLLRIQNIEVLLNSINSFETLRLEAIKDRLNKALSEIIEIAKVDSNRFEQELIYYIEKIDITEEKVRLKQHLNYFIQTLKDEISQGKKLSFITQEIGREINTLGSKANDFNIQQIVVKMKDELEKIKEQLGNVL